MEGSEPDLFLYHPSCHFQLEGSEHDHGRGHDRPSCARDRASNFFACQGTYFSSSYRDHDHCPCPCPYPCRLSQIVDEGCENVHGHGQSGEKVAAVEYACHSAKRRKGDSWPTENVLVNKS
jgi:hypothetical protein